MQRGSPALPDDSVVYRFSCVAIPDNRCFTLVGDADGCDLLDANTGLVEDFCQCGILGRPDFHGVMLDPAGPGINLREFPL